MLTIVTGGQTGVDRGALDAALAAGLPCDGWCPRGRWAEDGPIAQHYPLTETPSSDPNQRTAWNAYDSDATLVIRTASESPGTALALSVARRFSRPTLEIALDTPPALVIDWLNALPRPLLLNVAGPRESECPGSQAGTTARMLEVFEAGVARAGLDRTPRRVALVTGGGGFLGEELIRLTPPGWQVHWTHRGEGSPGPNAHGVELSDAAAVDALFGRLRPATVFHTAYSTQDLERDVVEATHNVARAAAASGAHLLHLSSDMVHDGERPPYDEKAAPAPINRYGRAKASAEARVSRLLPSAAIIRLSLITSFDPADPRTMWILSALAGSASVELYVDEIRSPILVSDLARQLWEIARLEERSRAGVWNLAGPESMSRYTLGCLVAAAYGSDMRRLRGVRLPAMEDPRPRDLRLSTARADRELLTRARPLSEAAAECRNRQIPVTLQSR